MSEEIFLQAVNECPFCASLLKEKVVYNRFPEGAMTLIFECSNSACEYALASKETLDMRYGYEDIEMQKHTVFARLEDMNKLLLQKGQKNGE